MAPSHSESKFRSDWRLNRYVNNWLAVPLEVNSQARFLFPEFYFGLFQGSVSYSVIMRKRKKGNFENLLLKITIAQFVCVCVCVHESVRINSVPCFTEILSIKKKKMRRIYTCIWHNHWELVIIVISHSTQNDLKKTMRIRENIEVILSVSCLCGKRLEFENLCWSTQ